MRGGELGERLRRLSGGELELVQDRSTPIPPDLSIDSRMNGAPAIPPLTTRPERPPRNKRERRTRDRILGKHERRAWESDAARRRRAQAKLDKHVEAYREKMRARGRTEAQIPPQFTLEHWLEADAMVRDTSGYLIELALKTVPPLWAAQARRAALGAPGNYIRDWAVERARNLATMALGLVRTRKPSKRKGRWSHQVRGFTRGALAALVQGARTQPVSLNTISGVHRGGQLDDDSSQLGYMQALERAGMIRIQQLPPERCEPWECWQMVRARKDGSTETRTVTTNRYSLSNPNPYDGNVSEEIRRWHLQLLAAAEAAAELVRRPRTRPPSEHPPPPAEPVPPDG